MKELSLIQFPFSPRTSLGSASLAKIGPRSFYERFTYSALVNPNIPGKWLTVIKIALGIFAGVFCLGTVGLGLILIMKIEKIRLRFQDVVDELHYYQLLEKEINRAITAINSGSGLQVFTPAIRMINKLTHYDKITQAIAAANTLPAIPFTAENIKPRTLPFKILKNITDLQRDVLYGIALKIIQTNGGVAVADEVLSYLFADNDLESCRIGLMFAKAGSLTEASPQTDRIICVLTRQHLCEQLLLRRRQRRLSASSPLYKTPSQ